MNQHALLQMPSFLLVFFICTAFPAQAQPPDKAPHESIPPSFRPGGAASLLRFESVKKELKLSSEQRDKLQERLQELRNAQRERDRKLRELPPQERTFAKEYESSKPLAVLGDKIVNDVLTPDQRKRLRQMELHADGLHSFLKDDVQQQLQLTPDQKKAIATLNDEHRRVASATLRFGKGGAPQFHEKADALHQEYVKKVTELLTEAQKKAWKDVTGEPFRLKID
jgi:hypothetical protein